MQEKLDAVTTALSLTPEESLAYENILLSGWLLHTAHRGKRTGELGQEVVQETHGTGEVLQADRQQWRQ